MNAAAVLKWSEAEGVRLSVKQNRICWKATRAPPPRLLAHLKEHKSEVIEALTKRYRSVLATAAGLPFDWLLTHYFTTDDLADLERGEGIFSDPAALGCFIKTDPRYPFGWGNF